MVSSPGSASALNSENAFFETNQKAWREHTLRSAYVGILDGDALDYELGRFRGMQEVKRMKVEEALRKDSRTKWLGHPLWLSASLVLIAVYGRQVYGFEVLRMVLFNLLFNHRPYIPASGSGPSTYEYFKAALLQAPIAAGVFMFFVSIVLRFRTYLRDNVPSLAILFDLCCVGYVTFLITLVVDWILLHNYR